MTVRSSIQPPPVALPRQIQIRRPKVDRLRNGEGKVKATQNIHIYLPSADCITLRVHELIGYRSDFTAHQADIPVLSATHAPHPAFYMDLFARAIHLPVIENIPTQ